MDRTYTNRTYLLSRVNHSIDGYNDSVTRIGEKFETETVGSITKIGLLLVQTIRVNNIGTCMVRRLPIGIVLIS